MRILVAVVSAPNLFSGNIHRPGTVSRDLLPGGELAGTGANEWTGAKDDQTHRPNRSIKEVLGCPRKERGTEFRPGDSDFLPAQALGQPYSIFAAAGAPLDNNICERALKKAILHRKNSLSYKTRNGARMGDLFISLIHTAELCGTNPFNQLTELQRHSEALAQSPSEWMPWNYRETLQRDESRVDTAESMMNPAWPETICFGRVRVILGNGRNAAFRRDRRVSGRCLQLPATVSVKEGILFILAVKPIEVKSERVIQQTATAIWQLVEPAENLPKWLPMARRSELVSGQGRGRIQRMYSQWGGKLAQIDQEVIEYEPARLLRWKHIRELIDGKPAPKISRDTILTIRLEPLEAGTRVTLLSQSFPGNALKALAIKLISKPRIRSALDKAMENLASLGV